MLKDRTGNLIAGIEQWPHPKRDYQWKPGRSARELASAWFRSDACTCPSELLDLLNSHNLTREPEFVEGCPEFVTALPERGEGRNHDLWLRGHNENGRLTVCVEAKADESFGQLVGEAMTGALRRSPRSRLPARAKALLRVLFGTECDPQASPWKDLRYQLVTGFAGTVLQSVRDHSAVAVLVIHEFTSAAIDPDLQRQNSEDLQRFTDHLFASHEKLIYGSLLGPQPLRSPVLDREMQLFVGKIQSPIAA